MRKRKLTKTSTLIELDQLTQNASNALKGGANGNNLPDSIQVPRIEIPPIIIRV